MTFKRPKSDKGRRILTPVVPERIDYEREPPAFCLRYTSANYCLSKCTNEEKVHFAERILKLSGMTWLQIRMADRHGLGAEKIEKDDIRAALPSCVTGDVKLLALRFSGMKPMVGFRQERLFHIIWFDREFTLYDHG